MLRTVLLVAVAAVLQVRPGQAVVLDKCELAHLLGSKYGMGAQDVKVWTCIAEYESTFNTSAINYGNWDGSHDHGLFQISNNYWCDSSWGKNECEIDCKKFLDDDLTDDLKCIAKIIDDTERWKGKGTGLSAWVAYVNRCEGRNFDAYMAECDNYIPEYVPKEVGESSAPADTITDDAAPATPTDSVTPTSEQGDEGESVINSAKGPAAPPRTVQNLRTNPVPDPAAANIKDFGRISTTFYATPEEKIHLEVKSGLNTAAASHASTSSASKVVGGALLYRSRSPPPAGKPVRQGDDSARGPSLTFYPHRPEKLVQ